MTQTFKALRQLLMVLGILVVISISLVSEGSEVIHQDLKVGLFPLLNKMETQVEISFPVSAGKKVSFLLHRNLSPLSLSADDSLRLLQVAGKDDLYSLWGLTLGLRDQKARISYQGQISDPVTPQGSSGFIASEGTLLWGATYWYPTFLGSLVTYSLEVQGPQNWTYINQGQLISKGKTGLNQILRFEEKKPQEEIYLIGGVFKTFEAKTKNGLPVRVLLKGDEKDLAQSYLALIPDFIQHYSQLLGPYPYSHFTVVENWWETGYGMPGFTLLGPTVLRLPFILSSSLPHEVLHNWFGNSVYVDYEKGNWAEGLTTYLSDYWQQDVLGLAKDYRLSQLIAYTDFANSKQDFPLIDFKGRHNSASQAVGYSKSMMVFHMLKKKIGTQNFNLALQNFYQNNLYRLASWADLQKSFEEASNLNLQTFFDQWLLRSGAPQLRLGKVQRSQWINGIYSVEISLRQTQVELYDLSVPVRWTLEDGTVTWSKLHLNQAQQSFHSTFSAAPVLVEIDPEFDLFRSLDSAERPASLSQVFGATEAQVFYTADSEKMLSILEPWTQKFGVRLTADEVTQDLIYGIKSPIILLGDSDLFYDFMKKHSGHSSEFKLLSQNFEILGKSYSRAGNSFVLSISSTINPGQVITWIVSDGMADLSRWGTRLTHYSKFGVLVFEKDRNVLKSALTPLGSPLRKQPVVISDFLSETF